MDHYEMLRNVSRTFALSIEQLPGILRDIVTTAYLMLRVSDCIEDHAALQPHEKIDLLMLWVKVLRREHDPQKLTRALAGLDSTDPEVYVAQHADSILHGLHELPPEPQQILTDYVIDSSIGMAKWQEHGPYVATEEEMDDYMLQVAGRVGYLLTDVFSWFSPAIKMRRDELMPLAYDFGLALQTVNIIRGLRRDYERGWVFVPITFYEKAGLSREALFDLSYSSNALQVLEMLVQKAERHLTRGLAYITRLPRSQRHIRLFCVWPLLFAVKTLAISRNNAHVLTDEAKITRNDIKRIIIISKLFSWSNCFLKKQFFSLYGSRVPG